LNIRDDPLQDLLEQFCYYTGYEWRWKLESLYELTEEELNHLHKRASIQGAPLRIDQTITYHLAKKILKT
jgi:hypothetical protein